MSTITKYVDEIRQLLDQTPYILSKSFEYEDRGGVALLLKGKIIFEDLSELHFREIVSFTTINLFDKIAYSYHFQDKIKTLIFRYDNAEHHPEIPSYPHHKHLPDSNIENSKVISLAEVIFEICQRFEK
ncbi:hypothetical protein JW964_17105 [candidate division KSB1 bacterium]|nr:hypothetical protein [candidate division KSB1 bacterium]